MGEDDKPPSLDKLGDRLRAAREQQKAEHPRGDTKIGGPLGASSLGLAFRIGVEMVSALVVGVGIGVLLDWWLDTKPLFLVVFFLLGAGAGIVNVYRATAGYGLAVGYRKDDEAKADNGEAGNGET